MDVTKKRSLSSKGDLERECISSERKILPFEFREHGIHMWDCVAITEICHIINKE